MGRHYVISLKKLLVFRPRMDNMLLFTFACSCLIAGFRCRFQAYVGFFSFFSRTQLSNCIFFLDSFSHFDYWYLNVRLKNDQRKWWSLTCGLQSKILQGSIWTADDRVGSDAYQKTSWLCAESGFRALTINNIFSNTPFSSYANVSAKVGIIFCVIIFIIFWLIKIIIRSEVTPQ